ncbi:MAG: hypothetical protein R2713_18590 [Ilumatobacteraceae bacterium]
MRDGAGRDGGARVPSAMALAMAAAADLRVEVFHDERSAAFAALGRDSHGYRRYCCAPWRPPPLRGGAVVEAGLARADAGARRRPPSARAARRGRTADDRPDTALRRRSALVPRPGRADRRDGPHGGERWPQAFARTLGTLIRYLNLPFRGRSSGRRRICPQHGSAATSPTPRRCASAPWRCTSIASAA